MWRACGKVIVEQDRKSKQGTGPRTVHVDVQTEDKTKAHMTCMWQADESNQTDKKKKGTTKPAHEDSSEKGSLKKHACDSKCQEQHGRWGTKPEQAKPVTAIPNDDIDHDDSANDAARPERRLHGPHPRHPPPHGSGVPAKPVSRCKSDLDTKQVPNTETPSSMPLQCAP